MNTTEWPFPFLTLHFPWRAICTRFQVGRLIFERQALLLYWGACGSITTNCLVSSLLLLSWKSPLARLLCCAPWKDYVSFRAIRWSAMGSGTMSLLTEIVTAEMLGALCLNFRPGSVGYFSSLPVISFFRLVGILSHRSISCPPLRHTTVCFCTIPVF